MPEAVDLVVHADWIVTVNRSNQVLENHSVAVKNGRIAGIMPTPRANSDYSASESVTLPGQVLMPGLINAHTHASMSLMRGMADDMPLMTWLQEQVWPVEAKWLSSGFVSDGAELAIAEMLLGGTTCFADMYFFPDAVAHAASRMGIRASIGIVVIQFPSRWAETESEYVSKGLAVRDAFNFDPLIGFHFAPHAPYTVTDESLASIHTLADELDMPIQMHVHETAHEVQTAVTESGKRPLQRLQEQGLLSPSFMAVHMTQLNDDEIRMLAATGIHVIHCPESNLKLASGFCPVATLLATGINVALGTDGAASNNDLDMLGEARTAALLAKGVSGNPEAVNSEQALQLATINGARALGLDEITGSLEPGKSADMISVDLACAATQPVYDPVSHLVYSACRDQVKNVWVSGKLRVVDGNLVGTDLDATIAKAKQWAKKIENSVDDK